MIAKVAWYSTVIVGGVCANRDALHVWENKNLCSWGDTQRDARLGLVRCMMDFAFYCLSRGWLSGSGHGLFLFRVVRIDCKGVGLMAMARLKRMVRGCYSGGCARGMTFGP